MVAVPARLAAGFAVLGNGEGFVLACSGIVISARQGRRGAMEEDERLDVFVSNVPDEPPPWDVWSRFAKGFLAEATPFPKGWALLRGERDF